MTESQAAGSSESSFLGSLTRGIARFVVRRYFPRREITGGDRIPQSGPVLLCSNHPNSLVDPIVIGITSQRPVRFLAKDPLFSIPLLGRLLYALGMIPAFRGQDDLRQVRRNIESLEVGSNVLCQGSAMGVFPEGKATDETQVEMVRSGASRMAMKAVVDGAQGLQIVVLGLNYEQKDRFRSSVWVQVAEPIDASEWLQQHEGDERKAMRALTPELEARLKQVVVHLDELEWEPLLEDLDVLVPGPPEARRIGAGPVRQRKRIADAMNHFLATDRPRTEATAEQITTWREGVHAAGLKVDSPVLQKHGLVIALTLLWHILWLILLCVPGLLGSLFHIVPFTFVRTVASRLDRPGRVTIATHRLLVSLPAYLLWYGAVGGWMSFRFALWFTCLTMFSMPFAGVFALHYWRRARVTGSVLCHQVLALIRREQLQKLRSQQDELRHTLNGMAEEFAAIAPRHEVPLRPSRLWLLKPIAAWALFFAVVGGTGWTGWYWFFDKPLRGAGLDLKRLSEPELERQLDGDEKALRQVILEVAELRGDVSRFHEELNAGARDFTRQTDNDMVREMMRRYLGYRDAMFRILWKYQRHSEVGNEQLRLRSFLLNFAAATVLYETSWRLVQRFDESPEIVVRLNEPEPLWDIPADFYDSIKYRLSSRRNNAMLSDAHAYYRGLVRLGLYEKHGLKSDDFKPFHLAIAVYADSGSVSSPEVAADEFVKAARRLHYRTQSAISTWIGDFRIREPHEGHTLIAPDQLADLRTKLKPGDILLERRNWYLSNAFLPGYWPHGAVYVGTPDDLKERGLDQNEHVRKHWEEFSQKDHDGHEHVIIEAVSEGVIFSTLEHSIGGGDSVAVLRPNLTEEQKNEAIVRAFSYSGRPYDFEFDFASTDKLVCTEVIYRSYGANSGPIDFPVVDILGRPTMPAINLVEKFRNERNGPNPQLQFIAFLDGDITTGTSSVKDEDAFVATLDLPSLTWWSSMKKRPYKSVEQIGKAAAILLVYFAICAVLYKRPNDVVSPEPDSTSAGEE
jgi:1-acyl-sn-glycerol-3-phosphate acyltransferase